MVTRAPGPATNTSTNSRPLTDSADVPQRPARRQRKSASLAPVQRGIWIASGQRLETDPYLVVDLSRVHGDVDPAILRDCLADLARRHDALRISFAGPEDPAQFVEDAVDVDLEFLDFSEHSDAEREAMSLLERRSQEPFDLAKAPIWRTVLVRLRDNEHLLLLTIHHLICDEWSLNLIHRELGTVYAAHVAGSPPHASPVPPAPSYADFADRQADRFSSAAGDRSMDYWRAALTGIPRELDLPSDFSRAGSVTHTGHKVGWTPTSDESGRFQELAGRLGVSPFLLMVTLFGVVIARHSGQPDLAFGTVVSGRSSTESERMVGNTVSLLPIPVRLHDEPTFGDAVRATKREFLGLLDHQDIAFDRIVAELGAGRSDLRMPLCQAHVGWSEGGDGEWSLGGARVEPVTPGAGSAKAEILLTGVRRRGEVRFDLVGEAGFFRVDTLRMLMDHFREAALAVVADSERSALALPLVGGDEARRLDQWSGSWTRAGVDTTIAHLFAEAAATHGEGIAVIDAHGALTYSRLDERSARWASELRRRGVSTDTVVGVALERSTEMVAAVLGILRAGGAYMALNVDGPVDYNAYCVAESKAAVVVARRGTVGILEGIDCPVVLSEDVDGVAVPSGSRSDGASAPDSLAYVSFTSGSTGKPKCVGITHRNILRFTYRPPRILHGPGKTFVQLAPLGFDMSALEIWACLLNGGRLVLPRHGRLDVPDIASILRDQSVSTCVITAVLFNQIVEQDVDALAGVGHMLIGGEAAVPAVYNRAVAALKGSKVRLTNGYGPTENTCGTSIFEVTDRVGASVPIGTPFPGTTVHVLDAALDRVPVGVVGELFAGGIGVSRGYLNDAGLTASRFLPDPYCDAPGARMYRTGDLARWRADGQLDFIGRADRQAKVRGFRVEPGEVEARLLEHPDVSGAVVVVHVGDDSHRQLVAYVAAAGGAALSSARLRAFAATRLPEHMVPTVITVIERIPMTPNGKVDRNALPAPHPVADPAQYRPPTTPTQVLLVDAWESVLGLDRVSVDASFFELGGDSVLAMRIAARVRDAGLKIASTDVFATPTIAELAAAIDTRDVHAAAVTIVPVPSGETALSPIQQWFVDQYGPQDHFNQSVRLRSEEPLDEALLQDAFETVVRTHDALRLRLRSSGDGWTQAVRPDIGHDLVTVVNIDDDAGAPDREAAIERYAAALQGSLDVRAGTVIRSLLIPDPAGRDDLIVVAHHLGMDTVSWEVLIRHLTLAYRQLQAGRTPELPVETVSFIDWTAALHKNAAGPDAEDVARRWRQIDERRAETMTTGAHDGGLVGEARRVTAELGASATRDLLRRPVAACSVDITAVLLTALARTLAEWTGRSEWIVDMEGHGRDALGADVDLSESIGWFTALFPVGLEIDRNATIAEQLGAVHRRLRAQPPGPTYGTHRYLRSDRPGSPEQSEVSFNYHGQVIESAQGLLLRRISGGIGGDIAADLRRPSSLEFIASVELGCLQVRLGYPAQRFAQGEMQGVVDRFIDHCEVIADAF